MKINSDFIDGLNSFFISCPKIESIQKDNLDNFFPPITSTLSKLSVSSERLQKILGDLAYRLMVFREAKRKVDKVAASEFNVFSYISVSENKISDILRDMLDPYGPHGQMGAFLKIFVEVIGLPDAYNDLTDKVTVSREESTTLISNGQRRMDIVIDIYRNGYRNWGITIENKPWAGDQHNQVDDYAAHLEKRYGVENYSLIYLTRDGSYPTTWSAADPKNLVSQAKLILMSYQATNLHGNISCTLENWINGCISICEAEKIRFFLRDMKKFFSQQL